MTPPPPPGWKIGAAPTLPAGRQYSGPADPPRQRRFSLHKIYWLFWLRLRLLLRGYTRDWRRIVGAIALLLIAIPFLGGLALATLAGYIFLPREEATELLLLALVGLYGFWAFLPLLEFSVNEGLDVTKLTLYPLTRIERMVSLLLATILDIPTLGIIALFTAILIGWSHPASTLFIALPALLVAYVHIVGFSQLILATFMGLLRSRRYRDLTIIAFALFGAACSLTQQVIARNLPSVFDFKNHDPFASVHLAQYLQFTPPGMAGRAISLASAGLWASALGWLALSAALTIPLLWFWMAALDRGLAMAETVGQGRQRRIRRQDAGAPGGFASLPGAPTSRWRGRSWGIPLPVQAILRKDLRYLWRDPQLKASMLSSLFILIVIFVGPAFGTGMGSTGARPWTVLISCLAPLFLAMNLSLNALGLERQALTTLFLFPTRPLHLLWGKNLAVALVALGEQIVLAAAFAFLTSGWAFYVTAVIVGIAGIAVMLGCGNVASVLLPFRVAQMRLGASSGGTPESGCLRALMGMLALAITLVVLSPVVLGVVLPLLGNTPIVLTLTLPLALVYGLAVYQGTTAFIAPRLLRREPEILAQTTRE